MKTILMSLAAVMLLPAAAGKTMLATQPVTSEVHLEVETQHVRFESPEAAYAEAVLHVTILRPEDCSASSCWSLVEVEGGDIGTVCDQTLYYQIGTCSGLVKALSGDRELSGTIRAASDDVYFFDWSNPREVRAGSYDIVPETSL